MEFLCDQSLFEEVKYMETLAIYRSFYGALNYESCSTPNTQKLQRTNSTKFDIDLPRISSSRRV